MSSNVFTEDRTIANDADSVVATLLYTPIVPSLCDGTPEVIDSNAVFDKEYETRTFQLSQNMDDNLTQLATPARTTGRQLHGRQVKFKYTPTIEECFYETSTRKSGDELAKELAAINGETMDILNQAWDVRTYLGDGGEYGGYRNSVNTVIDSSQKKADITFDLLVATIKEKIRALKEVAPILSTDLSVLDLVFTSAVSDVIYMYESGQLKSNAQKLQELFPNLKFTEANDRFKTDSKDFMALSFRKYLKLHRSAVPFLSAKQSDQMSNKVKSKYEYCTAAIDVKRLGAVQFVEFSN